MATILCVDSEPETVAAIESAGHNVSVGTLGYRTGIFHQPFPPHEFDAVVCDLKNPACFDALNWGPGGNNNFNCTLATDINDDRIIQSGTSVPRYKLIQAQQIKEVGRSNFDGHTILNAAVRAGTHVFLMYNPEWVKHVNWSFPNFIGLSWNPTRTIANKIVRDVKLELLLSGSTEHHLKLPLSFSIPALTPRQEIFKGQTKSRPIVTNLVDEIFGQVAITPKGTLWVLPPFQNNVAAILSAIGNMSRISDMVEEKSNDGKLLMPDDNSSEVRDVFISHAWEDKNFARPFSEHLRAIGVSVWFDEYELKLGDSLRRRIEDGLKNSRHGLVLLSQSFFKKDWPQKELDALYSLETSSRRILPILHGITHDELKQRSPLLADKFAISTDKGIPHIAEEIRRVLNQ